MTPPINCMLQGDAISVLKTLPDEYVDLIVCSPPYWKLRSYLPNDDPLKPLELGAEPTVKEYINALCNIFDEARRVLKKSGSLWVNIADCYNGTGGEHNFNNRNAFAKYAKEMSYCQKGKYDPSIPGKSLCGVPERFAIEMSDRSWIRRNTVVWKKPSCMPSSAMDRFTVDFEHFFFFTKEPRYYFETQFEPHKEASLKGSHKFQKNNAEIGNATYSGKEWQPRSEGRLKRSVWSINPNPFKGKHFATFPRKLVQTPILACCPGGGIVLDVFAGTGTTLLVAERHGRNFLGIDLNSANLDLYEKRKKGVFSPGNKHISTDKYEQEVLF